MSAEQRDVELQRLETQLEDRRSVVDFAWAFSLSCVAFVSGGLVVKLVRDSLRMPKITWVLALIAASTTVAAAVRLWRGRRRMSQELGDFERLTRLRREMGIDQPRLPQA